VRWNSDAYPSRPSSGPQIFFRLTHPPWNALACCCNYLFAPLQILCNGPGTCVPVCVIAYAPRLLGLKRIRLVYIESVCRVSTLSLSGRLLYPFVDHLLVQWPKLHARYPRCEYIGRLT